MAIYLLKSKVTLKICETRIMTTAILILWVIKLVHMTQTVAKCQT